MCIPTCTRANTGIKTHTCVYNDNYILQYLLQRILDLIKQNPKSTGFNELREDETQQSHETIWAFTLTQLMEKLHI